MWKKYLLKYDYYDPLYFYDPLHEERYFNTKEELIAYVKNGDNITKPEYIRVTAAFKLEKIDLEL